MKDLPKDRIDKTLLGTVTDWNTLFTEHRYGKMVRIPNNGGSDVSHPSEFYFLSSDMNDKVKSLGPPSSWLFLYVRATSALEQAVEPRMTPPIGHMKRYRTDIAAFKIIPWVEHGHALITATDYNHIAEPWVCFIPMESVPEINVDNTPRFTEADWVTS